VLHVPYAGDMVLYESHSILHGRPFPLKGRFFANVFVHFEPRGPLNGPDEINGDLPPYVIPNSLEEPIWRNSNPNGHIIMDSRQFATGSTDAHMRASEGDVKELRWILDNQEDIVNVRDVNGWTPLHEAIRTGIYEPIELLLDRGAEVNARVGANGEGVTALSLAIDNHGEESAIAQLLRERGGKETHNFQEL
jgi:prolyl 4-hydroxylase